MQYYSIVMQQQQAGSGNLFLSLLPMIAIFGVMYLLMIRPQKKKEKQMRDKINAMRVGDSIVTIGGIVGKVMNIADDEVTISTSVANTMMTFKKQAISTVLQSEENKKYAEANKPVASDETTEKKGFFSRLKKDKTDVE